MRKTSSKKETPNGVKSLSLSQRHYIHIDLYITHMHGVLMGSPPNVKYKGAESKNVVTYKDFVYFLSSSPLPQQKS